jgi:hypothetical protein
MITRTCSGRLPSIWNRFYWTWSYSSKQPDADAKTGQWVMGPSYSSATSAAGVPETAYVIGTGRSRRAMSSQDGAPPDERYTGSIVAALRQRNIVIYPAATHHPKMQQSGGVRRFSSSIIPICSGAQLSPEHAGHRSKGSTGLADGTRQMETGVEARGQHDTSGPSPARRRAQGRAKVPNAVESSRSSPIRRLARHGPLTASRGQT